MAMGIGDCRWKQHLFNLFLLLSHVLLKNINQDFKPSYTSSASSCLLSFKTTLKQWIRFLLFSIYNSQFNCRKKINKLFVVATLLTINFIKNDRTALIRGSEIKFILCNGLFEMSII